MEQTTSEILQALGLFVGILFLAIILAMAQWKYDRWKAKRRAQEEAFDRPASRKFKVIDADKPAQSTHKRGKR